MKAAVTAVLAGGVLAAAGAGTQPGLAIGFVRRAQRQRRIHSPIGREHHDRTGIQPSRALVPTQDGVRRSPPSGCPTR